MLTASCVAGVFTINYNRVTSTGQFDFGLVDTSKFTGSIVYGPLDLSSNYGGEWVVQFTGIVVNGVFRSYQYPVLFESGTSGSSIPRQIADWYFGQVPGSAWNAAWNQYHLPCSATLPDFTFGLTNGARVSIHGPNLLAFSIDGGTTCLSDLQVNTSDTTVWGFGANVIATMFMVFDFDNAQIGWGSSPLPARRRARVLAQHLPYQVLLAL
jgi:aspergillopepsin I